MKGGIMLTWQSVKKQGHLAQGLECASLFSTSLVLIFIWTELLSAGTCPAGLLLESTELTCCYGGTIRVPVSINVCADFEALTGHLDWDKSIVEGISIEPGEQGGIAAT